MRPRRAFLAALGFAVCAFALTASAQDEAPPDVPAGEARIEGRVIRGTANQPVPGVEVVLYALAADGMPGLRRAQSDASGAFAFEKISNTANVAYLVGARYQGIPVPGGRVLFAPGQASATADIRVADLTTDASALRIREQTLRLYREAEGLRVEETFAIENAGASIIYVPAAERAKRAPGLRATLPAGAGNFRMPLGVEPEGLARDGAALRYYGPFYPGAQDFVYSYRLPAGEAVPPGVRFAFEFAPAAAVEAFSVLVPEGVGALDAPGLTQAGSEEDAGRTVTRFAVTRPSAKLALALLAPRARVDASAVSVPEVQIMLHADDAAITVNETHLLHISGEGLLLGTPQSPLLEVPLPADASDVRFGSEASGLEFSPHPDGGVAVLGSVSPGEFPVQLAYRVPVAATGALLTRTFGTRVALLRYFVTDTGRLAPSSERLHRARPVRTEDLSYLALEAFDVAAGEAIALRLEALPPRSAVDPNIAKIAAALAAVGVVAWLLAPALRSRGDGAIAAPEQEPERNEREAVYDAMRDLDHDFETDKVSSDDHAQLRGDLRARAVALLQAEEGLASAEVREPSARVCPQCSAVAAPAHRFCASCGAPLEAPAA